MYLDGVSWESCWIVQNCCHNVYSFVTVFILRGEREREERERKEREKRERREKRGEREREGGYLE